MSSYFFQKSSTAFLFILLCQDFFYCHLSMFQLHPLGSKPTICLQTSCAFYKKKKKRCFLKWKLQWAEWMLLLKGSDTWSVYVHLAADARAESFSEVWRSWSSSAALNYADLNKANHPHQFETYWNVSVCQKSVREKTKMCSREPYISSSVHCFQRGFFPLMVSFFFFFTFLFISQSQKLRFK